MIVGGYSLHLYCDAAEWGDPPHTYSEFPHEFTGETYGECAKKARKRGWVLRRDRTAVCPKCRNSK